MSKADVIEVEGTVIEKLPNAMFQDRAGKRTPGFSPYQRKASYEFYPYFTR